MRRNAFCDIHPAVSFAFFMAVMLITAFVLHPVIVGISLVSAFILMVVLKGKKALLFGVCAALPLILAVALINPLFNHEGVTPLFYLKNGNAITLEAIVYGGVSACMFAALLMWFYCFNAVMTSDKLICLFGRAVPTLSLIFSMVLRFVPRLVSRIREVASARRSIAPEAGRGVINGIRHGISVLSVTVTWALESAVTMSDSMRSRGYGSGKRTSFAIFRFTLRDAVSAAVLALSAAGSVASMAAGCIKFRFYPSIKYSPASVPAALGFAAFALLCMIPVIISVKEDIEWRIIRSKL